MVDEASDFRGREVQSPIDAWFTAFRERSIESAPLAEDFVHSSPFGAIEGRRAYLDLIHANEDDFYSPTIEILDVVEGAGVSVVRYLVSGNPATDWIYSHGGAITAIFSYYHVGPLPSF